MKQAHTLEEVGAHLCPGMKDPVQFLRKRLLAGVIPGRKIGRHWYMTDDDVEAALEVFGNRASNVVALERRGLSRASLSRRAS